MDFSFTEEQEMTRQMVREFAEREIAPVVMEYDESQQFPWEIIRKLAELGLLGILISPDYGGSGMGYIDLAIIIEELSRVDPSIGLTVAAHNSLCCNHIYLYGTEKQKKNYLPLLASGKKLGAWALTEAEAGSDASAIRATAILRDGQWVLNGSKLFITNANVGEVAVVLAVTDKSKGAKGISAFILEKGMAGFRVGKKENKLGVRASDTAELIMEDCSIPQENLLGKEGEGFINALALLDGGRVGIAAFSVGIAQGVMELCLKYSKERVQFGKPIAKFQAIQWILADMATQIDAARLLTYRAAYLRQQEQRSTKEASMAKLYASEMAVRATEKAVQIFGGYGFTKDYPVEKFYRDVKIATIGEGTSEIQHLVIARQILE
ncbi:acyl-CoA dehydrogenase [bacterium (candidate division B38) B3_B38]|nr:MAG: acyl-CoA dehydrogenase [bacterium (candidate division B38) B3_B38]